MIVIIFKIVKKLSLFFMINVTFKEDNDRNNNIGIKLLLFHAYNLLNCLLG